ncbi:MAG: LL-diaminopimelate aminotransferase [Ignavibacteriales bacterium]
MSYIQKLFADRIGGSEFGKGAAIYKFERIRQAKAAAQKLHPDIRLIDLGVGEPDEMADMGCVETLAREAAKHENRSYSGNGPQDFKDAAVNYLEKVYGIKGLNPLTEVMHGVGSKIILSMIPLEFINPGEITLMTVPCYPTLGILTEWYGGKVHNLPLLKENGFIPDLDSIPEDVCKKAKLLYINYPNNPTGASATKEFFENVVRFAKKNDIVVIHDAAYSSLVFGDERPLAFLSVDGAKDVGIEIFSLSKAFNMAGWRIAIIAGNELAIKGLAEVKGNCDAGQFIPIQKASMYAFEHPEITQRTSEKYSRRHDLMIEVLKEKGFTVKKPQGSFFLYVQTPIGIKGGRRFENAEEFSQFLIMEKLISTVPWDDAGHFVRLSMTYAAGGIQEEKGIMNEIKRRLADCEFEFEK